MKILENTNQDFGRAFKRISFAFRQYFPNAEWVTENPDLEIVQVVGQKEYDYLSSKSSLRNVVMHQQCFLTTGVSIEAWANLWKDCHLVMSFHDLESYTKQKFNFFRTPLGADPATFQISKAQRFYDVFSTGHVAEPECIDKVFEACRITNHKMIHTGENFGWDSRFYDFKYYMNDSLYLSILQRVKYVTGLRLFEGFEMACIEGAMTGATPIVLDLPTYSYYKDFGIYIDPVKDITKQLIGIFESTYTPLSKDQIEYVRNTFSWETICKAIYAHL